MLFVLICVLVALVILRCLVKSAEAKELWLVVIAIVAATIFAMLVLPL